MGFVEEKFFGGPFVHGGVLYVVVVQGVVVGGEVIQGVVVGGVVGHKDVVEGNVIMNVPPFEIPACALIPLNRY